MITSRTNCRKKLERGLSESTVYETSLTSQFKSVLGFQVSESAVDVETPPPSYTEGQSFQQIHGERSRKSLLTTTSKRLRTRLVIGVDGTWCCPDGPDTRLSGNSTNVARIITVANESPKGDGTWVQKVKYFNGVNNVENWFGKQMAGAFGWGIDNLIQDVYKYCCVNATQPDDEIFLFGFSRGAFVVRAVACLLHWIRVPKDMNSDFDQHYTRAMEAYKDLRTANALKQTSTYQFLRSCNDAPPVKFLGVFDTVKAFDDQSLYDIGLTTSIGHARQALAMHEKRQDFAPEVWSCKEGHPVYDRLGTGQQSMIQSWFYGTHSDVGGSTSRDGLSLYPLQWMLSEARDQGLMLGGFQAENGNKVGLSNPEALIFPPSAPGPYMYSFQNGISVKMWDIRQIHRNHKHQIRVNESRSSRVIFRRRRREIFSQDGLIGYEEKEKYGTIIHPCVYMIYDTDMIIRINSESFHFHEGVLDFRQRVDLKENDRFWDMPLEEVDSRLKSVRILVCGSAGVGKSTLINKTFGIDATEESKGTHGKHDINIGLVKEGRPIIIHDFNGFQAGNETDIQRFENFLKIRTASAEIPERLHAIWYCVLSTRPRTVESVDEKFFLALQRYDSNVPVILVVTKSDELETQVNGNAEREYRKLHGLTKRHKLIGAQRDDVQNLADEELASRKTTLADEFARISNGMVLGPMFIDSEEDDTVTAIMSETIHNLHNDRVSKICIAAQCCSVDLKIDAAIKDGIDHYKHAARTSFVPVAGAVAGTSVGAAAVVKIMEVFGFHGFNTTVALETLKDAITEKRVFASGAVQTMAGVASVALAFTGIGLPAAGFLFAANATLSAVTASATARAVLIMVADTVLIMERAYWLTQEDVVDGHAISEACQYYTEKKQALVRKEVKALIDTFDVKEVFGWDRLFEGVRFVVNKHRHHKVTRPQEELEDEPDAELDDSRTGEQCEEEYSHEAKT